MWRIVEKSNTWGFIFFKKISCSVGLILCDPMDCSPPGFSVHEILQGRLLELLTVPFSRWSSWSRGQTQVSCIAGRFLTTWATWGSMASTVELMVTSKRTYVKGDLPGLLLPGPHPRGKPLLTHVFPGDPPILAGRYGSVSCRFTALFPWVMVHARFCVFQV